MPIESATYINQLITTNPTSADKKSTTDVHIRLWKEVIQNSFSGIINNVVSASAGEMNHLAGVTSNLQTQLNLSRAGMHAFTSGSATAVNTVLWEGSTKFVSTASASGTGTAGDFWFQYE